MQGALLAQGIAMEKAAAAARDDLMAERKDMEKEAAVAHAELRAQMTAMETAAAVTHDEVNTLKRAVIILESDAVSSLLVKPCQKQRDY